MSFCVHIAIMYSIGVLYVSPYNGSNANIALNAYTSDRGEEFWSRGSCCHERGPSHILTQVQLLWDGLQWGHKEIVTDDSNTYMYIVVQGLKNNSITCRLHYLSSIRNTSVPMKRENMRNMYGMRNTYLWFSFSKSHCSHATPVWLADCSLRPV